MKYGPCHASFACAEAESYSKTLTLDETTRTIRDCGMHAMRQCVNPKTPLGRAQEIENDVGRLGNVGANCAGKQTHLIRVEWIGDTEV